MSNEVTLERLAAGIKAANEAGRTNDVRALGEAYRALQAEQGQRPSGDPNTGRWAANKESMLGAGSRVMDGIEGFADNNDIGWLQEFAGNRRDDLDAQRERLNYQRPEGYDGILKNVREGDFGEAAGSLSYGLEENAADLLIGALGSKGAGALARNGWRIGAGAVTGSALTYGTAGALGEQREEARSKGLDDTLGYQDYATALASGLIELVPGAKGGFVAQITREGAQEMGQEGLTIGNTAIKGGEYVPDEVVNRLGDAGIMGGAMGAGIRGAEVAQETATNPGNPMDALRYDTGFDEIDRRLQRRFDEYLDGDDSPVSKVTDTGPRSAMATSKGVQRELRAEINNAAKELRRLADARGDRDLRNAVDTVSKTTGNHKSDTSEATLRKVEEGFPDVAEALSFTNAAREMGRLERFIQPEGDLGPLSKFTRYIDFTDGRNAGITRMGSYVGTGLTGGTGAAINRSARVVENALNRRSTVKRYLESVRREGGPVNDPDGQRGVQDILSEMKARTKAEKAAKKGTKAALDQSKLEESSDPDQYTLREQNTQYLFDEDLEALPEGVPEATGYDKWQQFTGLTPGKILPVIEALEAEGQARPGTAERFRTDIRSFKDLSEVQDLQVAVRQRANPTFNPGQSQAEAAARAQTYSRRDLGRAKSNRQIKEWEGQNSRTEAKEALENARETLTTDQYLDLNEMIEEMDRGDMLRTDRRRMLNQLLPEIVGPEMAEVWKKKLAPLVAAGPSRISEKWETTPEKAAEKVEQDKEVQFQTRRRKAAREEAKKQSKVFEKPASEEQLELDLLPPQTPANLSPSAKRYLDRLRSGDRDPIQGDPRSQRYLDRLRSGTDPMMNPPLDQSKSDLDRDAKTVKTSDIIPETEDESPRANKKSLVAMVEDRASNRDLMMRIAAGEEDALNEFLDGLPPTNEGRVLRDLIESGNERITQNMLSDNFASRFGVPYKDAARIVNEVLTRMENDGQIKRVRPYMNDALKVDGKFKKDEDSRGLKVLQIEVLDPDLQQNLIRAKSVNFRNKVVDPKSKPRIQFGPGQTREGVHKALKSYTDEEANESFRPLFNMIQSLRESSVALNRRMVTQIKDGIEATSKGKRGGHIIDELRPVVDEVVVKNPKTGKLRKQKKRDNAPLDTVSQIFWQFSDLNDTTFRQEWFADKNGRVYPRNGLAHTQGGDLMKGLTRAPTKAKVGGEQGLGFIEHSIGNILGFDKDSIEARRGAMYQPGMIDNLLSFAEAPFAQKKLGQTQGGVYKPTKVGQMVEDSEGFFQLLNVAHEVRDMVEFAKERFPKKRKMKPADLLQDPEVRADLAENYSTDFIVQLDANNNAYQLAGLSMGDPTLLQATGMQPRHGVNDVMAEKGADIYMAPSKEVTSRIPELFELNLPDSKVRKLFKGPIGNYLYEAAFNSRKESFQEMLQKYAGKGVPISRIEGEENGLITIPKGISDAMKGEEGHVFTVDRYDENGDPKETSRVQTRVAQDDSGKWRVMSRTGPKAKWKPGTGFATQEDAIKAAFETNLYVRMNSELIGEMNRRYPSIREYLKFADTLTAMVKDSGQDHVKIPTPDGIILKSRFKRDETYDSFDVEMADGKIVPLGVRTDEFKYAGRGVGAAMMHQLDAYVLREVHKRMKEQGMLKDTFNPIHDSYGFSPAEAEAGQRIWAEVMQELGQGESLFRNMLKVNGIDADEFINAGGIIPERREITPVDVSQIPTALS